MKNLKTKYALVFSLLMAVSSMVQAEDLASKSAPKKFSIAVSALEGRGLAEGEANTLTDALASHLMNTGAFRVLERGKMDLVLKEQGFQQSGACTDEACIVEMGQLLGVDHMVTGSIGKVGKTYSVNVRMIHVATGEIVRTLNKNYKGEIDGLLTDVMPAVAGELAGVKMESAPVVEKEPVAAPAPAPAPAVSTAAAPANEPAKSGPSDKKEQVKPKSKAGTVVLAILGVALVAGGVVVFIQLSKKTEKKDAAAVPTGTWEMTW